MSLNIALFAATGVYGLAPERREPPKPAGPRHNHVTRDVKPAGECPGCDATRERTDQ